MIFRLVGQKFPLSVTEISGLSVSVETESVKEGGQNEYIQKLPTYPQYSNLVLKKAMNVDPEVLSWLSTSITTMNYSPIPLTVSMLGEGHDPLISWEVEGAYPVKWETSNLQADQNNIVIETMEFAYQKFYVI